MKKRNSVFLTVLMILASLSSPSAAHANEDAPRGVPFPPFLEDGVAVFTMPFRKENRLFTIGTIAAVGATMFFLDDPIQDHLYPNRKEETADEFRKTGDMLQFAGLTYGTVLGLHGIVMDNQIHRREGVLAYETYLWSAAALGAAKWVAGRQRPEQTGDPFRWFPKEHASSFPSGHTVQAFAAATLISEHYRSPYITVPAYVAATSVGVSRALANKHWASDVLAGAALGTAIAHLLRKRHEIRAQERAWRIEPDASGIRLVHSF